VSFIEGTPVSGNGFKSEYFAKFARVAEVTSGFARGTGSSNGRWAITFRMLKVSLRLAAEPGLSS